MRAKPRKSKQVLRELATDDIHSLWQGNGFKKEDLPVVRSFLQDKYELDELDKFILTAFTLRHWNSPYNWEALRQYVDWEIRETFIGRNFHLRERLTDNEPVDTYEELVNVIQETIFNIPSGLLPVGQNVDWGTLLPYWDWILETYGPEIPHQDLIGIAGGILTMTIKVL